MKELGIHTNFHKTCQQIADDNLTFDNTNVNVFASNKMSNLIEGVSNNYYPASDIKPSKSKYSSHNHYLKRHKKKENLNFIPGSKIFHAKNPQINNIDQNFTKIYQKQISNDSKIRLNSKPTDLVISKNYCNPNTNMSEDKHLDRLKREKVHNIVNQPRKLREIEGQDKTLQNLSLDQNKQGIKTKQVQRMNESLMSKYSASRGSNLTNPQGGRLSRIISNSKTQESAPFKPGRAIDLFGDVLTELEK